MGPVAAALQSLSTCAHVVAVVAAVPIVGLTERIASRNSLGCLLPGPSPTGVGEAAVAEVVPIVGQAGHIASTNPLGTLLLEPIPTGVGEAEVVVEAAPIVDTGVYISLVGDTCQVSSFGAIVFARSRARPSCAPSAEASSSDTS